MLRFLAINVGERMAKMNSPEAPRAHRLVLARGSGGQVGRLDFLPENAASTKQTLLPADHGISCVAMIANNVLI
jgi:hypothetical protein